MNQNTKDLIDIAEEKNKIHTQYETVISSLREEINRLKNIIKEQNIVIETQKVKSIVKKDDIPSDIKILKDLIISQREELVEKDKEILFLREQIEKSDTKFLDGNNLSTKTAYQEELFGANQEIMELSIDIENYIKQIETLKQIIEERNTNEALNQLTEKLELVTKERENYKLINEDLEIHLNYIQKEMDNPNIEINENSNNSSVIDEILKDIEEERKIVSEKIVNYEEKISNLQNDINDRDNRLNQLSEQYENIEKENNQLNNQIQDIQKERKYEEKDISEEIIGQLEKEINELKNRITQTSSSIKPINHDLIKSKHLELENLPKYYQLLFLETLFSNITESNRNAIIDSLVRNLRSTNSDIRRFAIKILRNIKTQKIFDVLKDLVDDKEWLIRYYTIKALSEFEQIESLDKIMTEILKDNDTDVRQLAKNYFIKNNS
ncbi:MAG: HEAT repeat domain-containing protein [Candidatus Lokiarchaeota archaeon]|nr:HEAT repeat domain-containing protein [Candidatus Lokiarchaeota archaeon]